MPGVARKGLLNLSVAGRYQKSRQAYQGGQLTPRPTLPPMRQMISREARVVVRLNRLRHLCCFAVMRRVVASCNALKIWKFQHHLRDEVTFAQLCRSRCDALISAKGGSDVGCQLCDALGLIVEAAKLMLKDDAAQGAWREPKGVCLSLLKKNAASLRRGRMTRSLPEITSSGC